MSFSKNDNNDKNNTETNADAPGIFSTCLYYRYFPSSLFIGPNVVFSCLSQGGDANLTSGFSLFCLSMSMECDIGNKFLEVLCSTPGKGCLTVE